MIKSNNVEKKLKKDESSDENALLNTIMEENVENSQIQSEKNKLLLVTNELNKMKEILEKTTTKIVKIEKIYIEKDFKDNFITDEANNSDYLSENEDNIDILSSNVNNNDNNEDENKDDGSVKLMERIKFLKQ